MGLVYLHLLPKRPSFCRWEIGPVEYQGYDDSFLVCSTNRIYLYQGKADRGANYVFVFLYFKKYIYIYVQAKYTRIEITPWNIRDENNITFRSIQLNHWNLRSMTVIAIGKSWSPKDFQEIKRAMATCPQVREPFRIRSERCWLHVLGNTHLVLAYVSSYPATTYP